MKHSIKLYSNLFLRVIENVEFLVSPSSPTTLGFDYLAFNKPVP